MFFKSSKIPRFENSLFFEQFLYYGASMIFKIFLKIPFLKKPNFLVFVKKVSSL